MTDEIQHTQGNWHVFPRLKENGPNDGRIHVGPGSHSVAVILEDDNEVANAHLVAAAPTMKERLLRLNTMLSWYLRPDVDRTPTEEEVREMFEWTEEALADVEQPATTNQQPCPTQPRRSTPSPSTSGASAGFWRGKRRRHGG